MLRYALDRNTGSRHSELLRRCLGKLARHVWDQRRGRAAVRVQARLRGRWGRRRAKVERAVLLMRGRSGVWLLKLCFGGWAKPLKNKVF